MEKYKLKGDFVTAVRANEVDPGDVEDVFLVTTVEGVKFEFCEDEFLDLFILVEEQPYEPEDWGAKNPM